MPVLALLFNAFVWGVSWWPLRELNALGLHGLWATSLAFLLSTVVISLWNPSAWVQMSRHPRLLWITLASGTTNAAFNWGVMTGDVMRVVLLFYLMPMWSLLLARWLLAEPITARSALRIALAFAGAMIVLWQPRAGIPLPASLSDWLGVLSGAAFAVMNVMVRQQRAVPQNARALAGFIGGAVVAGAIALVLMSLGKIAPPPAPGFPWMAGEVAFGLTLMLGTLALQYGAARLPAAISAAVMLSEVVFAAASSSWIGGETLTPQIIGGGLMIIAATLLAAGSGKQRPEPQARPARAADRS